MPKISTYPLVTPAADDSVLGIQGGATVRFPAGAGSATFASLFASGMARLSAAGNSIIRSQSAFWVGMATQSRGKVIVERDVSVGGSTSAALVGQINTLDQTTTNCNSVLFMEGTNDAAQSVPVATHIANYRAAAGLVLSKGWVPLIVATPPSNRTEFVYCNKMALADRFFAEAAGLTFVDPWSRLIGTDGKWVAGASADSVHPLPEAEALAGFDMASLLTAGQAGLLLPRSNAGEGLFGSNVLQLTDTNADGLPDGWLPLYLTSPTFSQADAAFPFRGKKCSVAVSQSVQGYVYRQASITGVAVGDVLRVTGFVSVSESSNLKLRVFLRLTGVGQDIIGAVASGDIADTFFSLEVPFLAGVTNVQIFISVSPQNAGVFNGTVSFGGIDIYNVTQNTF